jgi:hypothetical protein
MRNIQILLVVLVVVDALHNKAARQIRVLVVVMHAGIDEERMHVETTYSLWRGRCVVRLEDEGYCTERYGCVDNEMHANIDTYSRCKFVYISMMM